MFILGNRLCQVGLIKELSLTMPRLVACYCVEDLKKGFSVSQVSHMMLLPRNLNDIGKIWKQTYLELRYFFLCTFCIWDPFWNGLIDVSCRQMQLKLTYSPVTFLKFIELINFLKIN